MEDEKKPGFMDKMMAQAMSSQQKGWDHCTVCRKALVPGTPTNKMYDDKLGSITVCVDCSLRAILFYVRKLHEGED